MESRQGGGADSESSDEEELEGFDDFTLASPWERFVAAVESTIRQWLRQDPASLQAAGLAELVPGSPHLCHLRSSHQYAARDFSLDFYFPGPLPSETITPHPAAMGQHPITISEPLQGRDGAAEAVVAAAAAAAVTAVRRRKGVDGGGEQPRRSTEEVGSDVARSGGAGSSTLDEDGGGRTTVKAPLNGVEGWDGGDWALGAHPVELCYGVSRFMVLSPVNWSCMVDSPNETSLLLSTLAVALANCGSCIPAFVPVPDSCNTPNRPLYKGLAHAAHHRPALRFESERLARPLPDHLSSLGGMFSAITKVTADTLPRQTLPVLFPRPSIRSATVPQISVSMRLTFTTKTRSWWWHSSSSRLDAPSGDRTGREAPEHDDDETALWDARCPWYQWHSVDDPVTGFELLTSWAPASVPSAEAATAREQLPANAADMWQLQALVSAPALDVYRNWENNELPFAPKLRALLVSYLISHTAKFMDDFAPTAFDRRDEMRTLARSLRVPFSLLADPSRTVVHRAIESMFSTEEPHPYTKRRRPAMVAKAAPPSSLLAQFSLHALQYPSLRAIAVLWIAFKAEVRQCWEQCQPLPGVCAEPPDLSACLVHQKLQMLALCIQKQRERTATSGGRRRPVGPHAVPLTREGGGSPGDGKGGEGMEGPTGGAEGPGGPVALVVRTEERPEGSAPVAVAAAPGAQSALGPPAAMAASSALAGPARVAGPDGLARPDAVDGVQSSAAVEWEEFGSEGGWEEWNGPSPGDGWESGPEPDEEIGGNELDGWDGTSLEELRLAEGNTEDSREGVRSGGDVDGCLQSDSGAWPDCKVEVSAGSATRIVGPPSNTGGQKYTTDVEARGRDRGGNGVRGRDRGGNGSREKGRRVDGDIARDPMGHGAGRRDMVDDGSAEGGQQLEDGRWGPSDSEADSESAVYESASEGTSSPPTSPPHTPSGSLQQHPTGASSNQQPSSSPSHPRLQLPPSSPPGPRCQPAQPTGATPTSLTPPQSLYFPASSEPLPASSFDQVLTVLTALRPLAISSASQDSHHSPPPQSPGTRDDRPMTVGDTSEQPTAFRHGSLSNLMGRGAPHLPMASRHTFPIKHTGQSSSIGPTATDVDITATRGCSRPSADRAIVSVDPAANLSTTTTDKQGASTMPTDTATGYDTAGQTILWGTDPGSPTLRDPGTPPIRVRVTSISSPLRFGHGWGRNEHVQLAGEGARALRRGAVRPVGSLMLVRVQERMYEPATQEPLHMTEDMLEERQAALAMAISTKEEKEAQNRMQSQMLASDMAAFKAANPGAVFEDFVRWHSPVDWIEDRYRQEPEVRAAAATAVRGLEGDEWQGEGNEGKKVKVIMSDARGHDREPGREGSSGSRDFQEQELSQTAGWPDKDKAETTKLHAAVMGGSSPGDRAAPDNRAARGGRGDWAALIGRGAAAAPSPIDTSAGDLQVGPQDPLDQGSLAAGTAMNDTRSTNGDGGEVGVLDEALGAREDIPDEASGAGTVRLLRPPSLRRHCWWNEAEGQEDATWGPFGRSFSAPGANADAATEPFGRSLSAPGPGRRLGGKGEESGEWPPRGQLSRRMQPVGCLWRRLWECTEARPADEQRQLFDATREAEKVLHYLDVIEPYSLLAQLFATAVTSTADIFARAPAATLSPVTRHRDHLTAVMATTVGAEAFTAGPLARSEVERLCAIFDSTEQAVVLGASLHARLEGSPRLVSQLLENSGQGTAAVGLTGPAAQQERRHIERLFSSVDSGWGPGDGSGWSGVGGMMPTSWEYLVKAQLPKAGWVPVEGRGQWKGSNESVGGQFNRLYVRAASKDYLAAMATGAYD